MKKIVILVVFLLLLAGGGFTFIRLRSSVAQEKGVLKVNSTPVTTIFLDNQNLGKTPFEDKVDPGEYTLKLIPESSVESVVSWEGRIRVTSHLLTYVNRELGDSELTTGGEILTLEKVSNRKSELAIISTPDGATVSLNGEGKGTTPLVLDDLEPDSYELIVATPGYGARTIKIKTTAGYKLTATFQLKLVSDVQGVISPTPITEPNVSVTPLPQEKTSPNPSASPKAGSLPPRPYVEILDTPTGFLRIRTEPSTSSEEVSRVTPGEYYALLDEEDGWYKIEYKEDTEGWISSQYAKIFE